jgi:hypothetical protein
LEEWKDRGRDENALLLLDCELIEELSDELDCELDEELEYEELRELSTPSLML